VCDDLPALQVQCRELAAKKKDVYFALASFIEKRVWSPTKINYHTKKQGDWVYRTQSNVKSLRTLFLDIDAGAEKSYTSQEDVIEALKDFCKITGMPKPTLVNSGYGIHVYWTLTDAVPRAEWRATAEKLKNACVVLNLHADHNITADEARVLRVPGTKNFKRGGEVPVTVLTSAPAHALAALDALLDTFLVGKNVPVAATRPAVGLPARKGLPTGVTGNLGATNDPLNGNAVVFSCAAMNGLVANRGATAKYPIWLTGLAVARYCADPQAMLLAVSDGHPAFNKAEAEAKMNSMTGGPPKCSTFWTEDHDTCEACPHWREITTVAELGRPWRETPPPPVAGRVLPAPPEPYQRKQQADGSNIIVFVETDADERTVDVPVSPYDIYPSRIMEQVNDDNEADECSTWIVHLPRKGEVEFKMPQSLLSDTRKLHAFLLSRGLHIHAKEAKGIQQFMTAYLKSLAKVVDRERMFERLGWHDRHQSFVLPTVIFHRDGTSTPHTSSKVLEAVTKNAIHTFGSKELWLDALKFYASEEYVAYRTFFYFAWGAPLLHMTGHKGILIAASGETGRGKTTLLEACASIYGNPSGFLVGGGKYGATMNAMFQIIGTSHSIPMFWDDTTERDPDEMREFMLHISTGKGKERMHGNVHDGKVVTWETIVLSSANTDDVHRVLSTGKDSNPHLMRFISVPFDEIDRSIEMKLKADAMKRVLAENYGFGAEYLQYITEHYVELQAFVIKQMERFDRLLNVTSDERHWSAALAVAYVGGLIAFKLGLSPFNPKLDEEWMVGHVDRMRLTFKQASSGPVDILNEFLESHVSNTLILSPKQSSHVDNIVNRPHSVDGLQIRHEVDSGMVYISKTAMNAYCTKAKANFGRLENELTACGVIRRRNCYKVLGADTPYAIGQTRCWEVDRGVLETLKGGGKK
jgi:hypothetical protein